MSNPLLKMPAPRILLHQVRDTAPWLWLAPAEATASGRGYCQSGFAPFRLVAYFTCGKKGNTLKCGDGTEHLDYLALTLACHHATVATYVPTDVDSKIRGYLWRTASAPGLLRRMAQLLIDSLSWDVRPCSRRYLETDHGVISGMNGEQLGSLVGAYGFLRARGIDDVADQLQQIIEEELQREATIWHTEQDPARRCQLAAILTHNVGDVGQGISYWPSQHGFDDERAAWADLARAGSERYQGAYVEAAALYRCGMSAEGHRNYLCVN